MFPEFSSKTDLCIILIAVWENNEVKSLCTCKSWERLHIIIYWREWEHHQKYANKNMKYYNVHKSEFDKTTNSAYIS